MLHHHNSGEAPLLYAVAGFFALQATVNPSWVMAGCAVATSLTGVWATRRSQARSDRESVARIGRERIESEARIAEALRHSTAQIAEALKVSAVAPPGPKT